MPGAAGSPTTSNTSATDPDAGQYPTGSTGTAATGSASGQQSPGSTSPNSGAGSSGTEKYPPSTTDPTSDPNEYSSTYGKTSYPPTPASGSANQINLQPNGASPSVKSDSGNSSPNQAKEPTPSDNPAPPRAENSGQPQAAQAGPKPKENHVAADQVDRTREQIFESAGASARGTEAEKAGVYPNILTTEPAPYSESKSAAPQVAGLMAGVLPVDVASLEENLQVIFERIEELATAIGAGRGSWLVPSITGVGVMVLGFELARRQREKKYRQAVFATGYWAGPASTWLPDGYSPFFSGHRE
jgi:hypothetical protein